MRSVTASDQVTDDTVKIRMFKTDEPPPLMIPLEKYDAMLDAFLELTRSNKAAITVLLRHKLAEEYVKERANT